MSYCARERSMPGQPKWECACASVHERGAAACIKAFLCFIGTFFIIPAYVQPLFREFVVILPEYRC